MSAHDRYLAGYSMWPVNLICEGCGWTGDGQMFTEYGATWSDPEECPKCYSELTDNGEPDGPDPD